MAHRLGNFRLSVSAVSVTSGNVKRTRERRRIIYFVHVFEFTMREESIRGLFSVMPLVRMQSSIQGDVSYLIEAVTRHIL